MPTLGEMIRERRRDLGLTLQALADGAGCAKSYLSAIENDRRAGPPSRDMLARMERALRLEPGELVRAGDWESTPGGVRRRVLSLETDRRDARRLAQALASEGVDALHRSGELQRLVDRLSGADDGASSGVGGRIALPTQVPLINKVQAGYPREFTDLDYPARIADEYVSVPQVQDPDAFAARVVGNSMEPSYHEGDIVVFSPQADATHGSDCFVRLSPDPPHSSETTFKRVFFEAGDREQRIRLQPLNSAYAPRVVGREAIAGLYRAVYVVRPVP